MEKVSPGMIQEALIDAEEHFDWLKEVGTPDLEQLAIFIYNHVMSGED